MQKMALRQAVALGSYARATSNFSELTTVPISASALQRLKITCTRLRVNRMKTYGLPFTGDAVSVTVEAGLVAPVIPVHVAHLHVVRL